TSSRNSEVIHAGLYYPPGSLKADLCLEGRERLYAWCARHGVGHRRIGKLLVAVEENEREKLQALAANARTSSRNSEVIHAGLYYPPGSLKADLCLEGRERL
ncbi:FAD-dependent oxidoreductase, partial [Pseudomonas aeruginosa]